MWTACSMRWLYVARQAEAAQCFTDFAGQTSAKRSVSNKIFVLLTVASRLRTGLSFGVIGRGGRSTATADWCDIGLQNGGGRSYVHFTNRSAKGTVKCGLLKFGRPRRRNSLSANRRRRNLSAKFLRFLVSFYFRNPFQISVHMIKKK